MKKREEKASRRNERKAVDMSQDVCIRSLSQEQEQEAERASQIQECQENKCSGAEERTKDACSPQKQLLSLLSSYPPHQLTHLQQTSPMLSHVSRLNYRCRQWPGQQSAPCSHPHTFLPQFLPHRWVSTHLQQTSPMLSSTT